MTQQQAIESLWHDRCSLIHRENRLNPHTRLTEQEEVTTLENQPCKLSYGKLQAVDGGHVGAVSQTVKLFLAPEVAVPAGSKIVVTHCGGVTAYARSGQPAVYAHHQEISLELWRRWA